MDNFKGTKGKLTIKEGAYSFLIIDDCNETVAQFRLEHDAIIFKHSLEMLEMLIDIVDKQFNSKYSLADLNGAISNARELIKSATELK